MCQDIQPNWQNVARKCQFICNQQAGFGILTIKILIGPGGEPVFWMEPEMKNIEPKRGAAIFLHTVLEKLVD